MRCCPKCRRKMTTLHSSLQNETSGCSVRLPVAVSHLELEWIERDISVVDVALSPCYNPSDLEILWKRAKRTIRTAQKFADKENKVWAPIMEHARLCREWQYKRLNEQATRLRLVRGERENHIKKNLKDLGWTDDIYYSTAFLQLAEVNKAVPLTPAEWSKISPKLVASLPKVRRANMAEIYCSRLSDFRDILPRIPGLEVRPRAIDMFLLPEVRDVLENDINTEMSSETMSQKFGPLLPELMRRWCDDAVNALVSLAQQRLDPESDVDPLNAMFRCDDCLCQKFMSLHEALSHSHLYQDLPTPRRNRQYARMRESRIYEEVGKEVYWSDIRDLGVLRVNKVASETRDSIIKAHRGGVSCGAWCCFQGLDGEGPHLY
ncbi:hypothetical protein OG21DRAFT_734441 [Imleria badia]|nr:hypothetical protein OG21DRAFT_734441 [Imleria badia]